MIALLFALTMQAATQDIIVSGKRLADAYAACVEQTCSTLRDAQVSIAYAEQQFRQGAYQRARKTLAARSPATSRMLRPIRNRSQRCTRPMPRSRCTMARWTCSKGPSLGRSGPCARICQRTTLR